MQRMMYALGQRHVVHQAGLTWLRVAEQMHNDSVTLEQFFRTDLEQAKDRLHQFFSRIYGYNYKLHRRFFFQFFTDLEAYMAGQRSRLDHLVENFFNQLRDSIVSLIERSGQVRSGSSPSFPSGSMSPSAADLNPALSSGHDSLSSRDEASETRRIRCLSDRVAQLRPFDDVDVRLKARMLEAYPPARMLINVLSVSSRLLYHLSKQVGEKPDCVVGMTRFQYCAICAGKPLSSVCPDSCPKLLSSCLRVDGPDSVQIAAIWPRLIDAVVMAVMRLERSFNFPVVNRQLQMEISEAITSLQTRYEQTKSKLESECRAGAVGRNVHTLFSSTGSNSRMLPPEHQSSLSGWRESPSGFRERRETISEPRQTRQARQVNPSFASPELLHWQTRQGMPHVNQFGTPSNSYGQRSPHTGYGQPPGAAPRPMWEPPTNEAVSDVPDRLMRWAAQAKRTYTALGNLFTVPGANFCSSGNVRPSSDNGTNSTDCWNPPDLFPTGQDYSISKTFRVLSEAMERLHQASNNNADPEALSLSPTNIGPSAAPALPFPPAGPAAPSYSAPVHPAANHPLTAQNGWGSQPAPPQFSPFDSQPNHNQPLEGSGLGPTNWDAAPPPDEREGTDFYQEHLQPTTTQSPQPAPYGGPMPHAGSNLETAGSGYGEYQPYEPEETEGSRRVPDESEDSRSETIEADDRWDAINRPDGRLPFQQPDAITTTTWTSTTPSTTTSTSALRRSSVTSPTPSIPKHTETRISTTINTTTTTTTTPSTSAATEAPIIVPPATHWRAPDAPQITPPVGPPTPPPRKSHPDEPLYGNLPDDEDNIVRQGFQPFGSTLPPTFPKPSWPEAPDPESQRTWWKDPHSEGSGSAEAGVGTQARPQVPSYPGGNYGPDMGKPEPSVPDAPVHYYPGSGQSPFQTQPDEGYPGLSQFITDRPAGAPLDPQTGDRSTGWTKYVQDPLQPYPAQPGSGLGDNTWDDGRQDSLPDGLPRWQEGPAGSGAPDPVKFPPTSEIQPQIPPVEAPPQLPVLHPLVKPKPSIPFPPLPPPEVWVPAQLAPGQPIPSVLLVREYNVQEPLYGPEVVQNKPNLASIRHPVATLVFVCIATLLI
ncbi:hypothetical protein T265_06508 [Opisthorchis viverrini]|uniref:Glypican n=1 Tax=Opisthorchis viverrini TaxID=6198 RepID=A0A074ZG32_OPIVI|nr:hypothetical protein T265_06508 [Opisthorchis viverrini]KER26231.1 hypothetical protein T265_06508 [Opisthorchis viverrini]